MRHGIVLVDSLAAWSVAPWAVIRTTASPTDRRDPPSAPWWRRARCTSHRDPTPGRPAVVPALRSADRRQHRTRPVTSSTGTACPPSASASSNPAATCRSQRHRPVDLRSRAPDGAALHRQLAPQQGHRSNCSTQSPLFPAGDLTLHLVGRTDVDGRYTARLQERLDAPDLAGRVVVHGPVDPRGGRRAVRRRRCVRPAELRRDVRHRVRRSAHRRAPDGRLEVRQPAQPHRGRQARMPRRSGRHRRPEPRPAPSRHRRRVARIARHRSTTTRSIAADVERHGRRLLRASSVGFEQPTVEPPHDRPVRIRSRSATRSRPRRTSATRSRSAASSAHASAALIGLTWVTTTTVDPAASSASSAQARRNSARQR